MKYFDYIVFDVDGTLADTEESVLSSLGQIIQEETGKTLPRHELEFALGIPGKNALEKLGNPLFACKFDAVTEEGLAGFLPGTIEILPRCSIARRSASHLFFKYLAKMACCRKAALARDCLDRSRGVCQKLASTVYAV